MKFDCYKSDVDGVQVVHVDTDGMPENEHGPVIRVYLNDAALFENPTYPASSERTAPKENIKLTQAANDKDLELFESQELVAALLDALKALVNHLSNIEDGKWLNNRSGEQAIKAINKAEADEQVSDEEIMAFEVDRLL